MTIKAPLVSVVIPAFRAAHTIVETLESVFAQDWQDLEIVVVNDGSPDNLLEVLAPFGARIRLHSQENRGLAHARNVGIELARGELVALLDNDDLCTPDRLSTQVRLMQARPELSLCASEFSAFDANGPVSPALASAYYSRIGDTPGGLDALLPERFEVPGVPATTAHVGDAYEHEVFGNFVHPPTIMFRRALFARIGGFDPTFRYTCDWEWTIRATRLGPIGIVDRPLLRYRLSPGQLSGGNHHDGATLEFIRVLEKTLQDDPGLRARDPAKIEKTLRDFYAEAAEAQADKNGRLALELLGKSLRHGRPDRESLTVAVRALLPARAIARVRELKRALGARAR